VAEVVSFTPEQFKALLDEVRGGPKGAAQGLGAPPGAKGLGCGDGGMGPLASGVYAMLAAGSPRLAYAKALGTPLAPYIINIKATFDAVDTTDVPNASNVNTKIVQDTLIDALVVRVQSEQTATGAFQNVDNFFFNFQSGIDATLDVTGAPRYSVAPDFTPLSTLADMINGGSHWPGGWILTYQQQLKMSFHANVPLPSDLVPVDVICSFRAWTPVGEMFVQMTNAQAFAGLAGCGFECSPEYQKRVGGCWAGNGG
jgi:hypothetical protein